MNKKRKFYISLCLVLVASCLLLLNLFPVFKQAYPTSLDDISNRVCEELPHFIKVTSDNLRETNSDETLGYEDHYLYHDSNFIYYVVDERSKKTLSSFLGEDLVNANSEDYLFYLHFTIDQNGQFFNEQASDDYLKTKQLESLYYQEYGYLSDAPQELSFYVAIVKEPVLDNGWISYLYYDFHYSAIVSISLFTFSILMIIFTLLFKIDVLMEIPFLKWLSQVKVELNYFLLGLSYSGLLAFMGMLMEATLEGHLAVALAPFFGGGHTTELACLVLNGIGLMLFGFLSVLVGFDLKYLFSKKLSRFFKEDTYLGALINWFKSTLREYSRIDYHDVSSQRLIKTLTVHLIVIAICCAFWWFGIIFALIYCLWLFKRLSRQKQQLENDFQILQYATEKMSEGDFKELENVDLGYFAPMKETLVNVSHGYETAIAKEVKSQKMKTELISNVSHDLKTPLTGITNYTELLEDENLDEETRKQYLNTLKQYEARLKVLIEDLFEVSKVNSGNISLELSKLDIVALIEQIKAENADIFEEKHLEVLIHANQPHIFLMLDSGKTYRIFENLFNNASKYSLANTRIYVEIMEMDKSVRVEIKNISELPFTSDPNELTERFVRGDKSRNSEGSGLGLAIVKSFMEVQKGQFNIMTDGDLFKAVLTFDKDEQN